MAYIVNGSALRNDLARTYPLELTDTLDGTAPAGCPIMSTCFVVDVMDVATCDGKDNWYTYRDGGVASIKAGQTRSELFA